MEIDIEHMVSHLGLNSFLTLFIRFKLLCFSYNVMLLFLFVIRSSHGTKGPFAEGEGR